MNFLKIILTITAIFGLFLLGRYLYFKPKFKTGVVAPDFSFSDLDGEIKSLEGLRGNYVLLDFWGSWCPPCRIESPDLVNTYQKYSSKIFDKNAKFEIVSIAIETNSNQWKKAIEKDGLNWKNHFAEMNQFNSKIAKLYGVKEIPTKYLINPDGKIVAVNPSFDFLHDFLDNRIQS